MWSFERFFFRIFLPLLFVAIVAVALRLIFVWNFNERHVRETPVESAAQDGSRSSYEEEIARKVEFSEENRSHVVAALQQAKQQLDQTLDANAKQTSRNAPLLEEARKAEEGVRISIQKLESADESNWEQRRERAYQDLQSYADAVNALRGGVNSAATRGDVSLSDARRVSVGG